MTHYGFPSWGDLEVAVLGARYDFQIWTSQSEGLRPLWGAPFDSMGQNCYL